MTKSILKTKLYTICKKFVLDFRTHRLKIKKWEKFNTTDIKNKMATLAAHKMTFG